MHICKCPEDSPSEVIYIYIKGRGQILFCQQCNGEYEVKMNKNESGEWIK